jgi:hypothetical protein
MSVSVKQSYYNIYGGGQFPFYGGTATGMVTGTSPFYPYFQFGQSGNTTTNYTTGQGYNLQYPQMFHFSTVASAAAAVTGFAQQYGGPLSLTASPQAQAAQAQAGTTKFIVCIHLNTLFTIQTHLCFCDPS